MSGTSSVLPTMTSRCVVKRLSKKKSSISSGNDQSVETETLFFETETAAYRSAEVLLFLPLLFRSKHDLPHTLAGSKSFFSGLTSLPDNFVPESSSGRFKIAVFRHQDQFIHQNISPFVHAIQSHLPYHWIGVGNELF